MYKKRKLKNLKTKNNRDMITITNCYAPHFELTKKKREDVERFYERLRQISQQNIKINDLKL